VNGHEKELKPEKFLLILKYIKIYIKVHKDRYIDKVYDLEKRKICIYNSTFPLNFEGLCNIAIEPLYFTLRETILHMNIHVFVK